MMPRAAALIAALLFAVPAVATERLNVLLLTVDDMSADSLGAFGCKLADTSPNIDRLAAQSMRFNYAHVQVANCMPSRNVLLSGRYPHNNGFLPVNQRFRSAQAVPRRRAARLADRRPTRAVASVQAGRCRHARLSV